jgi:hypothetical protein
LIFELDKTDIFPSKFIDFSDESTFLRILIGAFFGIIPFKLIFFEILLVACYYFFKSSSYPEFDEVKEI